jgi:hypothetical protein
MTDLSTLVKRFGRLLAAAELPQDKHDDISSRVFERFYNDDAVGVLDESLNLLEKVIPKRYGKEGACAGYARELGEANAALETTTLALEASAARVAELTDALAQRRIAAEERAEKQTILLERTTAQVEDLQRQVKGLLQHKASVEAELEIVKKAKSAVDAEAKKLQESVYWSQRAMENAQIIGKRDLEAAKAEVQAAREKDSAALAEAQAALQKERAAAAKNASGWSAALTFKEQEATTYKQLNDQMLLLTDTLLKRACPWIFYSVQNRFGSIMLSYTAHWGTEEAAREHAAGILEMAEEGDELLGVLVIRAPLPGTSAPIRELTGAAQLLLPTARYAGGEPSWISVSSISDGRATVALGAVLPYLGDAELQVALP